MSKLSLAGRPWVAFDANDAQHREWYSEFVAKCSWGNCPVRFTIGEEPGNMYTLERKLLEYYMKQEFNVEPPASSFLTRPCDILGI
jgi:hypothetical protein